MSYGRGLAAVLCLAICMLSGCGGGGGGSTADTGGTGGIITVPAQKQTVLVYMVGSDLESGYSPGQPVPTEPAAGAASADLEEMMAVGSTDNIKMVVQTGGAQRWANPVISAAANQRWLVKKNSMDLLQTTPTQLNMGDPTTLEEFIEWGVATHPADKYVLILWDHGGGAISDFGVDRNFNSDGLTLPELRQALQGAKSVTGKTFEVIGYDACLMATVEVAHNMASYANYLVASEETEPGHGWNYTAIMQGLAANTSMDGAALGRSIADSYKVHADSFGTQVRAAGETYNDEINITLSVIDLKKITSVTTALAQLAESIDANLLEFGMPAWTSIGQGRAASKAYGETKDDYTDLVDLKDLATRIRANYPAESDAVLAALNQAVVHKVGGTQQTRSGGLSIYLPNKFFTADSQRQLDESTAYANLDFVPQYQSMITRYTATNTDTTPPVFSAEAVNGNTFTATVVDNESAVDETATVVLEEAAPGIFTLLGMLPPDSFTNSNLQFDWDGLWLTLNDQFVACYIIDEDETSALLDIPVRLNGEVVDIFVVLNTTTGGFEILGAWPGIQNGVPAKEFLPIKVGDIIVPIAVQIDGNTGLESEISGTAFTVGASLQIGLTDLPVGSYQVAFWASDLAQNEELSALAPFDVPGAGAAAVRAAAAVDGVKVVRAAQAAQAKIREIRKR